MKTRLVALLSVVLIPASAGAAEAPSLSEVFKRVNESVVVVRTREKSPLPTSMGQAASVAGLGSGVLISVAGEVLTAAHVVQAADEVGVEFLGGEIIRAKVISSEPAADVALLRLERLPRGRAPVAALGDSDEVEVGEPVFIVGAPFGITHTLTAGHISARRKPKATLGGMSMAEFFQTDAAINQGNSGGPMFNMAGQVIGVVSHIISRSGGSEGLGFAVTSNLARLVLLEERSVWSGLDGYLISGDMARIFNLPPPGVGMLVQRIAERSPAERLGLQAGTIPALIGDEELIVGGDVILAVQGVSLGGPTGYDTIRQKLRDTVPGDKVSVLVLRKGETVELTMTAAQR